MIHTSTPNPDAAIVEAFHRWLDYSTAMNVASDAEDETAFDEEYWKALRALYETMEAPATGLVGLAIQSYLVLAEELAPGEYGGHSASIRLKDEDEVGPLPARVAAGLFASLCNIIPDFARLAQAKRGARLRLDLTRTAAV
ncbi:MAG: hypothetical protein WCJ64_02150 [Rhodospirillaceae bacterium]